MVGPQEDSPLVVLTNRVLLTVIRTKTACFRVTLADGVERRQGRAWAPMDEFRSMPAKLRLPMINRLRVMSDVRSNVTYGASLRLHLSERGLHVFDVCYAGASDVAAIVLTTMVVADDPPHDEARRQQATALLVRAGKARSRDEARARAREAVALVPEGDGARRYVLRDAAQACAQVGLFDAALEYFETTLPFFVGSGRIALELSMGHTLEQAHRLEEAARCYARAIGIAESLGPAHSIIPTDALGCVCIERGDFEAAERHVARAEELSVDAFGHGAPSELTLRSSRVRLLRARGELADADVLARHTMQAARRAGVLDVADGMPYELGEIALARGDAKSAIEHFRSLLGEPGLHPFDARVLVQLSRALHAAGKNADALAALRSAANIVEGAFAHDHPLRIDVERELALHAATSPYR